MDMKFSVGEKVTVRGRDMIGEIVQMEYKEMHYLDGKKRITKKYLVKQVGSYYQSWFDEDDLIGILELSDTYASKVYDVLIDIALMTRDFEMVKMLAEEKEKVYEIVVSCQLYVFSAKKSCVFDGNNKRSGFTTNKKLC